MSHQENSLTSIPEDHNPNTSLVSREIWEDAIAFQTKHLGEVALPNAIEPLTLDNMPDKAHAYDILLMDLVYGRREAPESLLTHINSRNDSAEQTMTDSKVLEYIAKRNVPIQAANQKLTLDWPKFEVGFRQGVKRGIELGYIPSFVEKRLTNTFSKTGVRVIDTAIIQPLDAQYIPERNELGLRHDILERDEGYDGDLTHETAHQLSGGTFEMSAGAPDRKRIGYATRMDKEGEKVKKTGINEAVTHHVTLGLLSGDFETIDPDMREEHDETYYEYRKVLGRFIGQSKRLIDVKTLTNGFFEDTGPEGSTELRKKLVQEVKQAYGWGALNKLEKLCELSTIAKRSQLEEVVLSRIHAPEIDKQGNVVKQGWIDTENLPSALDLYKK
jgi:hypothetical protein